MTMTTGEWSRQAFRLVDGRGMRGPCVVCRRPFAVTVSELDVMASQMLGGGHGGVATRRLLVCAECQRYTPAVREAWRQREEQSWALHE